MAADYRCLLHPRDPLEQFGRQGIGDLNAISPEQIIETCCAECCRACCHGLRTPHKPASSRPPRAVFSAVAAPCHRYPRRHPLTRQRRVGVVCIKGLPSSSSSLTMIALPLRRENPVRTENHRSRHSQHKARPAALDRYLVGIVKPLLINDDRPSGSSASPPGIPASPSPTRTYLVEPPEHAARITPAIDPDADRQ